MRYVMISDVHGEYDKMINALSNADFDPQKDTLVTLGDLFDRGSKSKEVLEYVMGTPRHICIWGNHELRLKQVIFGAHQENYDKQNGMQYTLQSFCRLPKPPSIYWGMQVLKSDELCRPTYNLLLQYFDECVNAIEWDNLICTHGWIPCKQTASKYLPDASWREANPYEWDAASWAHSGEMLKHKIVPDKDMVVGHWHSWRIALNFGGENVIDCTTKGTRELPWFNCNPYIYHLVGENAAADIIFIDGMSNYENGGKVNTFVYESDAAPKLIPALRK